LEVESPNNIAMTLVRAPPVISDHGRCCHGGSMYERKPSCSKIEKERMGQSGLFKHLS
jgi:hypothetical protein